MNHIKQIVRALFHKIAVWLNRASHGRVRPNHVTLVGFAMHLPIAWLIAMHSNLWAAILLVIFGLFDTLDGELARVQKRASVQGMLLDASTDRMKEALIYSGAAYAIATSSSPTDAAWAAAACGASLCVSYVKAKGEAAVATQKSLDHATLNRMFKDGLFTFEVRMAVIVLGLAINQLLPAVIIVAIFSSLTAAGRLVRISKALSDAQD